MTRRINLNDIENYLIGFHKDFSNYNTNKYPLHNVSQNKDNPYISYVELAVAGFSEDELTVELKPEDSTLTVSGKPKKEEQPDRTWITKNISSKSFEKIFKLAEHVEVNEVTLSNGILCITLEKHIPEAKKPKVFAINSASNKQLLTE